MTITKANHAETAYQISLDTTMAKIAGNKGDMWFCVAAAAFAAAQATDQDANSDEAKEAQEHARSAMASAVFCRVPR